MNFRDRSGSHTGETSSLADAYDVSWRAVDAVGSWLSSNGYGSGMGCRGRRFRVAPLRDNGGLMVKVFPKPADVAGVQDLIRSKFGRSYGPVRIFIAEAKS